MKNQDLYNIATSFRSAIMEAKHKRKFSHNDHMRKFPVACCDDSCDLLAYYLYTVFKIRTKQIVGTYRDDDPCNTMEHAWLIMDDNTIIDITGDQFKYVAEYTEEVYVGKENSFYKGLEDKRINEYYDIAQNDRLWNDYQVILSYMQRN